MDIVATPPQQTDQQIIDQPAEPTPLWQTDLARGVVDLVKKLEREDEFARFRQVMKWRKHIHYWNNFQYLAESVVAHDWMTPEDILAQDPQADIDPALYAKVINIYKAHGEILIGALSSGVPTIRYMPADADDTEDVSTAKAASQVAELIQQQNKARLLLMKALFIMYNQGLIFAYNEQKEDSRFGEIAVPEYEEVLAFDRDHYCPQCGFHFGSEQWQPNPQNPMDTGPTMAPMACPQCGAQGQPETDDAQTSVQQQVGTSQQPKNRECIEIYGPLNVRIPLWCKDQSQTPYLDLETEESVHAIRALYSEIEEKIVASLYPDSLERESRVPTVYRNDFPRNIVQVQRVWLRPSAYTELPPDNDVRVQLEQNFTKGLYVVIINGDIVAEMLQDELDDHWTLSENPLSEVLHAEPLGAALIPLQDITNELANLTLETIEFGIPEVFADTRILDFTEYSKQEARPGQITPATGSAGTSISQGFHEVKAATLSREVEAFADRMTSVSQFVMGTFPSIFGGVQESRGGTAKEYELSKASALQRLSSTWTIVQEWWAKVMGKSVRSYIRHMKADEKFVKSQGDSFVNVWLQKSEMSGEIGQVEPEVSETFPVSWTQKRDIFLSLIQMQDPQIAEILSHPENASLVASVIGVPELYIPGDDDRNKQLAEIAILLQGQPTEGPPDPMTGQPSLVSTVPPEMELDDHKVEGDITRAWLISPVGQYTKLKNPPAYANVLAHMKEHRKYEQMMQQPQMPSPDGGSGQGVESLAGAA